MFDIGELVNYDSAKGEAKIHMEMPDLQLDGPLIREDVVVNARNTPGFDQLAGGEKGDQVKVEARVSTATSTTPHIIIEEIIGIIPARPKHWRA